jgi:HAD domain in Swiss Army Knife RNA repair proteins
MPFDAQRPPRSRCPDVLYLDFDGCLHPEDVRGGKGHPTRLAPGYGDSHALFEHAELLTDLLEPYPQVRIVLSTSWVRVKGYSYTVSRLPAPLAMRCCGATWHSAMEPVRQDFEAMQRGRQVLDDFLRRKPERWLALDDDSSGWAWAESHYICSDPIEGIAAPRVLECLKARLSAEFAGTSEASGEGVIATLEPYFAQDAELVPVTRITED